MENKYRISVLKLLLAIFTKMCNQSGMSKKEAILFEEVDAIVRKMQPEH